LILNTERLILRPWEEADAEPMRELMRYAFEELNINMIWCGYFDGNIKSKRVQEKCGLEYHHTAENVPCAIPDLLSTEHITRITKEKWSK